MRYPVEYIVTELVEDKDTKRCTGSGDYNRFYPIPFLSYIGFQQHTKWYKEKLYNAE